MEESKMEVDEEPSCITDLAVLLSEKIKEIELGVVKKEPRLIQKVVASVSSIRKLLNDEILGSLLSKNCSYNCDLSRWTKFSPQKVDQSTQGKKSKVEDIPEVEAFLHLLVLFKLINSKKYKDTLACSNSLIQKVCYQNRRTMESIAAKAYFYHSRVFELNGELSKIRNFLISRLRSCTLKSDTGGQAVLINCILRNYLEYNLYENADKFVSKVKFPDQADNNEWARFLYYLARIKATRLEYSEAQKNVTLALRKAPESSAFGFKQAANKLAICIELLLGDIPDKKIFKTCKMKNSLDSYCKLSQAVRDGNLHNFNEVLETFGEKFRKDHTYYLILRLRRNVIKIAIRAIGLSYSRISPAQIAKKLDLDSAEEALYILAKAIRDGVLEAHLVQGFLVSQEIGDIYKTLTPTEIYRKRITACLELHNYSVKSMRYPMKKYESKLGSSGEHDDVVDDFDMFVI